MGDNVTFNAALAANLGVAQGKCIAHSLNLIVGHTYQKVPDLITLTLTAGSILTAGGSGKRLEHWRNQLGLNPTKAMTYANRFGGSVNNARYRAANFAVIKEWVLTLVGDDEEINDLQLEALITSVEPLGSRIDRVVKAYRKNEARATLLISELLLGDIPQLIGESSGEGDNVPASFYSRLRMFGEGLNIVASSPAMATAVSTLTKSHIIVIFILFLPTANFFMYVLFYVSDCDKGLRSGRHSFCKPAHTHNPRDIACGARPGSCGCRVCVECEARGPATRAARACIAL